MKFVEYGILAKPYSLFLFKKQVNYGFACKSAQFLIKNFVKNISKERSTSIKQIIHIPRHQRKYASIDGFGALLKVRLHAFRAVLSIHNNAL